MTRPLLAGLLLLLVAIPAAAHAAPANSRSSRASVSVDSGLFDRPFQVTLTPPSPDTRLVYSNNGTLPDQDHGIPYTQPIRIRTTTLLRVAAPDLRPPPPIETRTYLFPGHVDRQSGEGFPDTWGFDQGRAVPADYAMDPEITQHPAYRDALLPALRALPSVSLVMDPDDLFDARRGIYANPRETGSEWERPVSVAFLDPVAHQTFLVEGGIRIQGGWNRRPEESPKHAFRLVFRKKYGPATWKAPLFPEAGAREFDELILRAGCNNTWLHWKGEERRRGDYLRDQWMRDSLAAMDHPSARGRFVHLYLDGLYWGVYNLTERPSAPFVAAHFGGSPADYDARNGNNLLQGDDTVWRELVTLVETAATHPDLLSEIEERLDFRAFSDFMLLNLYGANGDWDGSSNWYAARRRSPPGPYHFFVWDGERTLEGPQDDVLNYDAPDSPPRLFQKLRRNPVFRKVFADRARLHLTGQGSLTPENVASRFARRAAELDVAIVAESARWGDYRRDLHPYKEGPYELYTRDDHWRPEVRRLLDSYFPQRTGVLVRQLEAAGLWPTTRTPDQ